jgi:hypothetical protein
VVGRLNAPYRVDRSRTVSVGELFLLGWDDGASVSIHAPTPTTDDMTVRCAEEALGWSRPAREQKSAPLGTLSIQIRQCEGPALLWSSG